MRHRPAVSPQRCSQPACLRCSRCRRRSAIGTTELARCFYEQLAEQPQIVAAQALPDGWAVYVIRYGRLAGAGFVAHNSDYRAQVDAITATAAVVTPSRTATAGDVRETFLLQQWLEHDGVRLLDGELSSQLPAVEPLRLRFAKAIEARNHAQALLEVERRREYFNGRSA